MLSSVIFASIFFVCVASFQRACRVFFSNKSMCLLFIRHRRIAVRHRTSLYARQSNLPNTQMTQMKCFHFLSPAEDERSAVWTEPKGKKTTQNILMYLFGRWQSSPSPSTLSLFIVEITLDAQSMLHVSQRRTKKKWRLANSINHSDDGFSFSYLLVAGVCCVCVCAIFTM